MSDQTNKGVSSGAVNDSSSAVSANSLKRLLIVVIVVSLLGALFAYGLLTDQRDRSDIGSPLVGKELPAFTMPLFSRYTPDHGETFAYAEHAGQQPMVVNFWASWCAPCFAEAPELQAAAEEYGSEVLFVGINTQDGNQDNAQEFLDRFDLTFPNGRDESSRVSVEYGIFGLPETFFINADGTLNYKHAGPLTPEILAEQTQALIQ